MDEPVHVQKLHQELQAKGSDGMYACFLGKVERQDTYALTDGAQVALSKRIR